MLTSNEFYKGVDKDTDRMKLDPARLRDAHNIRIVNKDGQGFVVTNIGGNEHEFSLTAGFIPLGSDEYNGVAYILSFNVITGQGEIGTYPSPNPNCVGGFQHVYSPLTNFTVAINPSIPGAERFPFRTTLFNFDCEHQARVTVRVDFDNSVNVYFADYKNPIRSINSGFNQDGECTGRLYWNGSFPNAVDLLSETCAQPNVDSFNVQPGGCHKAGNWFYFFRYNTTSFDPTSFLAESNAVQMSPNPDSDLQKIEGALGTVNTGKQVTFNLSNIDINYPYLEVGFLHYHDGTVTSGMIDNLFDIPVNSTTLTINITGCENIIDLDLATLLKKKIAYDVVKDIDQLENRLWGANCKTRTAFHPDLLAFAQAIIIKPDDSLLIGNSSYQNVGITFEQIQYKNYQHTYAHAGYMRGEAYPFAIRFVFTSGRLSEPIPMKGYDAWLDPAFATLNDDGIFRFPNLSQEPGQSPFMDIAGFLKVMGVKFDVSNAILVLNGSTFMQDNVCGFYFTRGERKTNAIYQGVTVPCGTGVGASTYIDNYSFPNCAVAENATETLESTYFAPRFGLRYPYEQYCKTLISSPDREEFIGTLLPASNKYGFFSADHFFNKNLVNKQYPFYKFADIAFSTTTIAANVLPSEVNDAGLYTWTLTSVNTSVPNMYNVQEWNESPTGPGFVSEYGEGNMSNPFTLSYHEWTDGLGGFQRYYNRGMAMSRYIGVDNVLTTAVSNYALYNIYTQDPVTGYILTDQYDVKSVNYFKISGFISITNLPSVNAMIFYRGDCHLQRTYFKDLYNPNMRYSTTEQDDHGNYRKFGSMFSIISEITHNTAMRFNSGANKYYPGFGFPNEGDFVYDNGDFESDALNVGYDKQLSGDGAFGFDKNIPFRGEIFHTRVIGSNAHTPNSFSDGYRIIDEAVTKDFDLRLGPINALRVLNSRNVIVQQSGVSFLYINDRAVLGDNVTAGQLILGNGDVLSQKQNTITDQLGTQHQWSVYSTQNGLYGADANKRKIWRLAGNGAFEILSDTKNYKTEVYEIIENGIGSDHSDIIDSMPDNPVCRGGIVAFYERKYGDVGFTFIFDKERNANKTIRYNEWIDAFTGSSDPTTAYYLPLNEDFFSFNPAIFSSITANPFSIGDVWMEGRRLTTANVANNCVFYGVQKQMRLTWVVNNASDVEKAFDFLAINASPNNPLEINYRTINQLAVQNPFVNPLEQWMQPSYRENEWRAPIRRADTVIGTPNNIFNLHSYMRGTWMETELVYETNESIFVKSVATNIRQSFQ